MFGKNGSVVELPMSLRPGVLGKVCVLILIGKLYNATFFANYLIHQQGRSDPQFQGMGATFTGLGLTPTAADIIQVRQPCIPRPKSIFIRSPRTSRSFSS